MQNAYDPSRSQYKNIRKVNWTNKGSWTHPGQAVMKTLTDITAYTDYVIKLNALFQDEMEASEINSAVGVSDRRLRELLQDLVEEQLIVTEGENRWRKYKLKN